MRHGHVQDHGQGLSGRHLAELGPIVVLPGLAGKHNVFLHIPFPCQTTRTMTRVRHAIATSLSILLLSVVHAQISFEYEDLAVPGDVVERYVDTLPSFGPGGSGAAQAWDFSSAIPHETLITTVSLPSATPYASSFTGSNVAMTNDGVNYLYFNASSASLLAKGAAGDFLNDGQQLIVPFNPDLTSHVFPRNFGDNFSDTYAF
jgi:hypothetical protein